MSILSALARFLALEPLHELTFDPYISTPDLATQMAAMRVNQAKARPWRAASIDEALGVPAILRAVTLISNTTGSLSVEGLRNGEPMAEAPRIITRPDPFHTPQEFYRDMAWQMATRGETIAWIAARDRNGQPTSLVVVPLAEMSVTENERNRLYPRYEWLALDKLGRKTAGTIVSTRYSPANPEGDFVHVTYAKLGPMDLRGVGPLQLCGAAMSVAVEAQEWAANFYASGGGGGTLVKSAIDLSEDETIALKTQWTAAPNNVPRVIGPAIEEVTPVDVNPQGSQMLSARDFQNGDAARAYGIPGKLLEYSAPGSSLTYQNVPEVWLEFVRGCLAINYLAPLEQAFSDLLPRPVIARFYVDGLLRADIKTRYDVYALGITSGVLDIPTAQKMEGLSPGNIERAPVPASPPAAIPSTVPHAAIPGTVSHAQPHSMGAVRCDGTRVLQGRTTACDKLLAESGPFVGTCPRCKKAYEAPEPIERRALGESFAKQPAPVVQVDSSEFAAAVTGMRSEFTAALRALPAPVVQVDLAPFAAVVEQLKSDLAPKLITRRVERDRNGRIVAIHEEVTQERKAG